MAFKDHFSEKSDLYNRYRPGYPAELFSYLAGLTEGHRRAWDCGTGTGQAASALTEHYSEVIATDASGSQIDNAVAYKNVLYRVATAEHSGLEDRSIDLITVAQALHWFDLDAFSVEVGRVLAPGGVLAVWTYGLTTVDEEIDRVVYHLYEPVIGEYWPKERVLIEQGYEGVQFPFVELTTPKFDMVARWDLEQLLGYLHTWSAVRKYHAARGVNPVEALRQDFLSAWGEPEEKRSVRWPLILRVWRP